MHIYACAGIYNSIGGGGGEWSILLRRKFFHTSYTSLFLHPPGFWGQNYLKLEWDIFGLEKGRPRFGIVASAGGGKWTIYRSAAQVLKLVFTDSTLVLGSEMLKIKSRGRWEILHYNNATQSFVPSIAHRTRVYGSKKCSYIGQIS